MIISSSEFKNNIGKYLALVQTEDIIITRNGKPVARLVAEKDDKVALAKSLIGILPATVKKEDSREEKSRKHEGNA